MKTIFLDRDGTINRESGYINHYSMFDFITGAIEALASFKANGWQQILITNQAGIARGYFTEDLLIDIHEQMQLQLDKENARLDAIYYCPHHPDVGIFPYKKNCQCRKPNTGMIERAMSENSVDLDSSYMVGDRYNDIRLGKEIGLKTVLVLTGYGRGELENNKNKTTKPDHIFDDLLSFATWLNSQDNH